MPIYEYHCTSCGHRHEALQKVSDPLLKKCPACGEDALNKLISAAGFRLSGTGWYETDFKSGDKKNLSKTDADKGSGDANKTQPASDAGSKDSSNGKSVKESKPASSSSGSVGNTSS